MLCYMHTSQFTSLHILTNIIGIKFPRQTNHIFLSLYYNYLLIDAFVVHTENLYSDKLCKLNSFLVSFNFMFERNFDLVPLHSVCFIFFNNLVIVGIDFAYCY